VECARHRLTPPYFDRCTVTGVFLDPAEATVAGFLDRTVAPDQLGTAVAEAAQTLAAVDRNAHTATKLRTRERAIAGVREGVDRLRAGEF
jgi:enoyl-CoA hydratase